MYFVETSQLVHRFSEREPVLNNIALQVPEGSIYGFLGPNGAGKTTTLRLILGLLRKQAGDISIFGKPFTTHRVEILKKVGSLIESPSIYGHLTATENLALLRTMHQCPKTRIQEVLQLVGLAHTGKKKARQFSLGMKQRLSIAIALLHNPALLILDEPTNGLDPNGILEVRELLQRLNRESGVTVLVSSHLLSEIEKLVTHIGIIHKGNMKFQGTLNELQDKHHQSVSVFFDTSDQARAMQLAAGSNLTPVMKEGKMVLTVDSRNQVAQINQHLVNSGLDVYEIGVIRNDLEKIFMDLINN